MFKVSALTNYTAEDFECCRLILSLCLTRPEFESPQPLRVESHVSSRVAEGSNT